MIPPIPPFIPLPPPRPPERMIVIGSKRERLGDVELVIWGVWRATNLVGRQSYFAKRHEGAKWLKDNA